MANVRDRLSSIRWRGPVVWGTAVFVSAIALFALSTFSVAQQLEADGGTINVAGQQRALVERHLKELLFEQLEQPTQPDATWQLLTESMSALAKGGDLQWVGTEAGETRTVPPIASDLGRAALGRMRTAAKRYEAEVVRFRAAPGDGRAQSAATVPLRAASDTLFDAAHDVVVAVEVHEHNAASTLVWVTFAGAALLILGVLLAARRFAVIGAERRRAEEDREASQAAVTASHNRLQSIIDGAVDPIIVIDESGTIQSANMATTRQFGYSASEMIGQNVKMLAAEPFRGEHDGYLAHYMKTGTRKVIGIGRDTTGQRKDGTTFSMHLSVSEATTDGRRMFTGILRDISEVVEARASVQRLLDETQGRVEGLLEVVGRAAEGDLSVSAPPGGDDSLGQLATGLGSMVTSLRALVGAVQRSGVAVAGTVNELAATARQQEASTSEQAATATEIAASAQEISATTHTLADTVSQVNDTVDATTALAWGGQQNLRSLEATMDRLAEAGQSIAHRLGVLSEKAGAIHDIVATISRVADQTNLLSLNAAIEAEKAGEYGRGFSVVATEIRRLADQTAVSTLTIEQTVREMQGAVDAGVMSMEKFDDQMRRSVEDVQTTSTQLGSIAESVRALGPRFSEVNEGMQSQSSAADQIREAVTQLRDVARMTADSLRESGTAISRLNTAAQDMQADVAQFHLTS